VRELSPFNPQSPAQYRTLLGPFPENLLGSLVFEHQPGE